MKDRKVWANHVDIHVVDYGGNGETILCVHGLTANSRCFDHLALQLKEQYHVLSIDLRGRGDSEKPASGYDIHIHARDIHELLKEMDIESCVFIGHSLGAFIGLIFAARYPEQVRKLVLVDGGCTIPHAVYEKIKPAIARLDETYPSFSQYIAEMKKNPFFHPWTDWHEQYFYFDCIHMNDGSVQSKVLKQAVTEEVTNLQTIDPRAYYEAIQAPTLLLRAEDSFHDEQVEMVQDQDAQHLLRSIPNSQYKTVKDANHYSIIFQKADETVRMIKNFLENRS